jgi:hypothetical protein
MGTIRSQFADSFIYDEMGTITGSATAVQLATNLCNMVRFKANNDNVNVFWLGQDANNTAFPMYAGDDTGWVSTSNLDRYWHQNNSGAVDYLHYWLQA